jgi:hypothetical protein
MERAQDTGPAPAIPSATPAAGSIFFADVPGATQSQVQLGHPGPLRTIPEYESLRLLGQVLGGGFSSRINMKIREDKGYAYSARAGFSYHRRAGSFSAGSAVHAEATVAALEDIAGEIRRIREEPVTFEELEREREGTLLGLPSNFSTAERVRSTYAGLVFFGLPLDWYDGFQRRLAAVTVEDVLAAARTHLRDGDYAVKYADSKGVLMVHAAGNDGENLAEKPSFPTPAYLAGGRPNAWIEVGASSWKGLDSLAAPFSNYGKAQVDVFAPGVDILSTVPGGGYERESGTSMAAPVVTGLAAMLMSYYPNFTAADVKRIILDSATRYADQKVARPGAENGEQAPFGSLSVTGGIVNAYSAVKLAEQMSTTKP